MSTLYNTRMQVGVTLFFGHFNELWPLTNSSVINAALRLKKLPTPGLDRHTCGTYTRYTVVGGLSIHTLQSRITRKSDCRRCTKSNNC